MFKKNMFKIIEFNSKNISKNLDFDDNFLNQQNLKPTGQFIRFWEIDEHCIVLGKSNKRETEVRLNNLKDIPLVKRSSGGGTVCLGPGCLCYSLFLETKKPFDSISNTTSFIMNKHKDALRPFHNKIEVQGISDLSINNKKFSGNSQRRKNKMILFHGTFLYNFELSIIADVLAHPSKEPVYRQSRKHVDFITNLNISKQI